MECSGTPGELRVNADGGHEVDLHGFHPYDEELFSTVQVALERAYDEESPYLRFIHGHGFNRDNYRASFVNSNTGYLGITVRRHLRDNDDLRRFMLARFDCSDCGATTVRIRPKPQNPS